MSITFSPERCTKPWDGKLLRTRKKHELQYVKTRLVALDFVLGHPQHHYLETEADKVAFFKKIKIMTYRLFR